MKLNLRYSRQRTRLDLVTSLDKNNIRIWRPHESGFIAYSKISTPESGIKKLQIRMSDSLDTPRRKPYQERKSCESKISRFFLSLKKMLSTLNRLTN